QRFVRTHKMIVSSPPFYVSQQMWGLLDCGPGATRQCCQAMTHREIHPLDESGVQPSREAEFLQGGLKSGLCSQAHHVRHTNQLAPPVAFLHLAVDPTSCATRLKNGNSPAYSFIVGKI